MLEPGESLADASIWADEHRRELPKTAPWHYVDVPLDEPRYHSVFAGDVPERGYVVDKIHDFRVVVNDAGQSVEDRRIALRFLVHFVEDLHMPMHVGDNNDKGGNRTQVRFFDRGTNLHSLWDSGMIEYVCDTEDFWLRDLAALDTTEARAAAMKGTIEDWATESLLAARQAYQVPETGKRLKSGQKLADAYLDANLPVARRRLYQARRAARQWSLTEGVCRELAASTALSKETPPRRMARRTCISKAAATRWADRDAHS